MSSKLRQFVFGDVAVKVAYSKAHDEYQGELSWPEVSDSGVCSRSIKHYLKTRLPASSVLVQFTDVTKPASPTKLEEAAIRMVLDSGLPRFLWTTHEPSLVPGTRRGPPGTTLAK